MRAILANEFGGPDVLQFATVPSPTPGMGELLIQIEACGVCFHDLLTRTGLLKRGVTLPFIPGHEPAGRVLAIGPAVENFEVGQRVCCLPVEPCWRCHHCLSGQDHLCANGNPLGHSWKAGGYAELIVMKATSCLKLPDDISSTDAAILGCAVGAVYRGYRLAEVRMGQIVVVTGAGGGDWSPQRTVSENRGRACCCCDFIRSESRADPSRRC
jgi:acryloyl-coenzyme A reductase